MKLKQKARLLAVAAVVLAMAPALVRAYSVAGPSMAPTLWLGDHVIALQAAYDFRFPYTDRVLFPTGEPRRGDVVVYYDRVKESFAIKRIVGLPGDAIELRDNVVHVNGVAAEQTALPEGPIRQVVPIENGLAEVIAAERFAAGTHAITYTPGASKVASHGPTSVPENEYFLLGDHRDNSHDSRFIGCITRDQIKGRVVYGLRSYLGDTR